MTTSEFFAILTECSVSDHSNGSLKKHTNLYHPKIDKKYRKMVSLPYEKCSHLLKITFWHDGIRITFRNEN